MQSEEKKLAQPKQTGIQISKATRTRIRNKQNTGITTNMLLTELLNKYEGLL